ncbi:hypothetical protein ACHQM5_022372 [Ranunculus cassubicifolius]
MSRTTKWKLEKLKVKVVFRLQFHATQIPPAGWDKLFVSLISVDSGKVTAKTSKSAVRNGTCKWGDPIYETTRLLQDTKTKQLDEKLYKLIVAMGTSRSSLLGEANINLADYADASTPSSVSLPLHGSNPGCVLHVTVQLLTSKTGFREFEQQSELRERGLQTTTRQRNEPAERVTSLTRMSRDQTDKVNSKVRFQSESSDIPSLGEVELTEDYTGSAIGIDDSSNTSESVYAEKHDSSTYENESLKSTMSGDLGLNSLNHSHPEKGDPSDHRLLALGSNEWSRGWSSDISVDNDSVSAYEENSRLRGSLEMAESSTLELKQEMSSLQSHADELGIETDKCCQLLAKEMASGETLASEVSILKSECSKFKNDFEMLKHSLLIPQLTGEMTESKNWAHMFQDIQMRWLQGLFTMDDKVSEVRNNAYHKTPEKDSSFSLADLNILQQVIEDLKQDTAAGISLLNEKLAEQADVKEREAVLMPESALSVQRDELVSDEPHPPDATFELRDKISQLQSELEESKNEQDNLTRKLDQMECYYEAFIQELEENQKRILGELHDVRNEHSTCIFTITSCNTQMEKMHDDINEQLLKFSEERLELETVNKELERRIISSENALKRARWNSSIAVDQLQKDLELLSFQVLSMFKTKENLIQQAFVDTSQSCFQDYPDDSSEAFESPSHMDYTLVLRDQYEPRLQASQALVGVSQQNEQVSGGDMAVSLAKAMEGKRNSDSNLDLLESMSIELQQCQNQNAELKKELLSVKTLLEGSQISLHAQEKLYQKAETEINEMHLININLNVLSSVLQESLGEASKGIGIMKEQMDALGLKLFHSTNSEELLKLSLQTALEDVNTLRVYNNNWSTKCDELTLMNQILEEKVCSVSNENDSLTEKITEMERRADEYRGFKRRYKDCTEEKNELLNLLKKETSRTCSFQDEVSSLHEELITVKAAADEQFSVNRNLKETLSLLQDKLVNLRSAMLFFDDHISEQSSSVPSLHDTENQDLVGIVGHLEELQHKACAKIQQLTLEKKDVEEQRDTAQGVLTDIESENLSIKKRCEIDVKRMANRLEMSTGLVDKLQLELETIANKLKISLESEESYSNQLEELSSKLSVFEVEMQNVTNENRDLSKKITGLECISEELDRTKLAVIESARENQALLLSFQSGNEESVLLSNELGILSEKLRHMTDEVNSEKILRVELEGTIADLTSELKMKNDILISFDDVKIELVHLKQLVSDLELEKSRVCDLLLESEESQRKADEDASFYRHQVTDLEAHLCVSLEHLLSTDVELICTRNQYQSRIHELVQQLESIDGCYRELHLKHLRVLTTLNGRISSEAHYVNENARLLTALDSLKAELEVFASDNSVLVNKNNAFVDENARLLTALDSHKAEFKAFASDNSVLVNKNNSYVEENSQLLTALDSLKAELEASASDNSVLVEKNNAVCVEIEKYKIKEDIAEQRDLHANELIDNLKSSRDELEFTGIVLRAKLEEYCNEVMVLQNQKSELSQRLSEQILRTEEFKNLSVHLRELKDKSEAAYLDAREKREIEIPALAQQESLRMAFIREQCETKVQELRNQLYLSKKHGDEMLLKLQDALSEVEDLRKSEASSVKRTEELLTKITELETELQIAVSEKREKGNAFDKMKAELECSLISLDCCKEEKQKVEASLRECREERAEIALELGSIKERMKISAPPFSTRKGVNLEQNVAEFPLSSDPDDSQLSLQDNQSRQIVINQEDLKQLSLINEHFKAQSLRSSMENLHEELERMKNENLVSPQTDLTQFEPVFHGLQRQLLQLQKANEQLSSIFPLFNEFPESGNALERVLALELELAESLQAKKKSTIQFQSSFLKQHTDEEAVFRSFRDINELIKDMLELKREYLAIETELKEMHDRYSQLSLAFAEVEGERQKLVMTLKNTRSPRKNGSNLFRSTCTSLDD